MRVMIDTNIFLDVLNAYVQKASDFEDGLFLDLMRNILDLKSIDRELNEWFFQCKNLSEFLMKKIM